MKKATVTARLLALTLLLSLVLTACGGAGLSGTYVPSDGSEGKLVFSGSNITMVVPGDQMGLGTDFELKGTYKITGNKIAVNFSRDEMKKALEKIEGIEQYEAAGYSLDDLTDELMSEMGGELANADFAQSGNTITIAGQEFKKQ